MKKILLIVIPLLFLFVSPVYGEESPLIQQLLQDSLEEVEGLSSENFNFLETAEKLVTGKFSLSFESVLSTLSKLFLGEVKENLSLLIKILVLSVLAGVLCHLVPEDSGGISAMSFLACFLGIAGLSASLIASLSQIATETIDKMLLFMASLMPVMSGLVLSANAFSAGFFPGLFAVMQGFCFLCRNLFLPMILVLCALTAVSSLSSRFHINRLIDALGKGIKWSLGISLTVFLAILGLHSFTAKSAATVAGKTIKYALCNFIPLVGGVLSDSAEAVLAGMGVIRGAVGITGVLALLSFCTVPLFKVLATSFLYRFASGAIEPATDKRIVTFLSGLSESITLIFSILLMVIVMFILSLSLICTLAF